MVFPKGHIPWNQGTKGVYSKEYRNKLSQAKIGKPGPWLGKKRGPHSEEWRMKISLGGKGKNLGKHHVAWNKGKPHLKIRGEKHPFWKGGITPLAKLISRKTYLSSPWVNWRKNVFERDKYTCQECGVQNVYLEPHHILPLYQIFDIIKDMYGELTYEKVIRHKLLFSLKNGITLCQSCHIKTRRKEELFEKKYSQIAYQVSAY